METESSLVIESNQEASDGHVILDKDSVEEVESVASVAVSSSSETLEELVDQMEIEISDHEGDGEGEGKEEGSEEEEGGVKLRGVASNLGGGAISVEEVSGGGMEKVKGDGEMLSEKIEISTRIGTGRGDGGRGVREGERMVPHVRASGEEGGVTGGRRRRQSSSHDRTEFPPISLQKQLSNEDILELMGLLQVSVAGWWLAWHSVPETSPVKSLVTAGLLCPEDSDSDVSEGRGSCCHPQPYRRHMSSFLSCGRSLH